MFSCLKQVIDVTHIPLNKHLHRIARVPSPMCPACEEKEESVHHFLLSCPAYTKHRAIMNFGRIGNVSAAPTISPDASCDSGTTILTLADRWKLVGDDKEL
ncbi:hypothetical protein CY34DRAFT_96741 [Suillus luteus UH-Slu-Lm8-n1]|uniref:Reverse transcriptase zinc-binding domain-containing protein n=1 Tax=Suillus luteus UH-Slu-Lm8-n1 TaxID=930992 RepID=A0A0D0AAG3_9AGAM|nr:hypothetical protein CY34DRAFT_96741 [Suillus luteus UH-Slu-Lm8-n1]